MKRYLILFLSILIDGLIGNLTIYSIGNLSYFTPLCTVVSLVFLYDEKHFIGLFLFSFLIYGGLYMSNILLSLILFFIVMLTIKLCKHFLEDNFITLLLQTFLVVVIYEGIFYEIASLLWMNQFQVDVFLYKLSHTVIINVLYSIFLYYTCSKNSSKFNY